MRYSSNGEIDFLSRTTLEWSSSIILLSIQVNDWHSVLGLSNQGVSLSNDMIEISCVEVLERLWAHGRI